MNPISSAPQLPQTHSYSHSLSTSLSSTDEKITLIAKAFKEPSVFTETSSTSLEKFKTTTPPPKAL